MTAAVALIIRRFTSSPSCGERQTCSLECERLNAIFLHLQARQTNRIDEIEAKS